MAWSRLLWLLLLLLVALPAAQPDGPEINNTILSEDEDDTRYTDRRRQLAAEFTLARERAQAVLSQAHHAEAERLADSITAILVRGEMREARRAAVAAQRSHGYSRAAGRFQHLLLRSYLATGDLRRARLTLIDLESRFPDHPGITDAYHETLLIARKLHASAPLINLDAATPHEVINADAVERYESANKLFRHLVLEGDIHQVAPEAALHYARSLLATGYDSRERVLLAREAYEVVLTRFPECPHVFDALCELAVSHLIAYRGDQFDRGALIAASALLHRARPYVGDDARRADLLQRYRAMIRRWQQDRDLVVARWYRRRDQPERARYFYAQAISHDPTSTAGIAAAGEMAELPEPARGAGG
jgi:hypothetical protein